MNNVKRKGFTLVELLIVIVVIGVLSAMMMLSSTEAVTSAKASNIISNLTQLKKAVLSWYVDNLDKITVANNGEYKINNDLVSTYVNNHSDEILKYLSNGTAIKLKNKSEEKEGNYILTGINLSKKWYICYVVGDAKSNNRLKEKLAAKAASVGLQGSNQIKLNGTDELAKSTYNGQKFAFMLVLDFEN